MKSLRNLLFLTLILTPALSFSADLNRISAPSVITAVTVYADRALTTRSATLNLKAGSYLIAFEALPPLVSDAGRCRRAGRDRQGLPDCAR